MGASDASLSGVDRRECHRAHFYADVEITCAVLQVMEGAGMGVAFTELAPPTTRACASCSPACLTSEPAPLLTLRTLCRSAPGGFGKLFYVFTGRRRSGV
jgi:hypothetical protein